MFTNIANKVSLFDPHETKINFYGGTVVGSFNFIINAPKNQNSVFVLWNYDIQGAVNIDISNSNLNEPVNENISNTTLNIKRISEYIKSADPKNLVLYYPSQLIDIDNRLKVSSSNNVNNTNIIGSGPELNNILTNGINVIIIIEKNAPNVNIKISRPPININNAYPKYSITACPKCLEKLPSNYCDNMKDTGIMCNAATFWIMITLAILVFILIIIIIWLSMQ